jgi:hypothetical protein
MTITTTTILPPMILQRFDSHLLCRPMPGIKESTAYKHEYESALKKYGLNSRKMRDFNEILEINEKLYEWKKAQEAYDKATTKDISERPIAPLDSINRIRGILGKELRDAFTSPADF